MEKLIIPIDDVISAPRLCQKKKITRNIHTYSASRCVKNDANVFILNVSFAKTTFIHQTFNENTILVLHTCNTCLGAWPLVSSW